MSTSTDAILFYGYAFEEEDHAPWPSDRGADVDDDDEEEGWEDRWARLNGIEQPEGEYDQKKYGAYLDKRFKLTKACGVEIDTHCSGDVPMYLVAVVGSKLVASRGYPEKVPELAVGADWDEKLHAFMEKMSIKRPRGQKPAWRLVSYWG